MDSESPILHNLSSSSSISSSPHHSNSSQEFYQSSDSERSVSSHSERNSSDTGSDDERSDAYIPPIKKRRITTHSNASRSRQSKSSSSPSALISSSTPPLKGWKVPFESVLIPFAHFEPKVVEKILAHKLDPESKTDMFLVKWKNFSYLHREWITSLELEAQFNGSQRIKRFFEKQAEITGPWGEEGFNPSYLRIDRLLDEGEVNDGATCIYYLVKWENMPYDQATWETKEVCEALDMEAVDAYLNRRNIPDYKRNALSSSAFRRPFLSEWKKYEKSPKYKNNNQLRPYQLEGLNWLTHCWLNHQSSIMADEMGLGKTVQSVAFLNELWSVFNVRGPFLVVAPLSTVPHWEREFKTWSEMNVIVYHGRDVARNLIVDTEYYWKDKNGDLIPHFFKFDVLITTYEMAMVGVSQLRPIHWRCCILDEAHKLKNKSSKISEFLKTFTMEHRVLLTGTPIQNSVVELWALLNFLQPEIFFSEQSFMAQFGSLKTSQDVERLQRLLKPLMLRRMKEDVETSIPIKEETVIRIELTNIQKKWYRAILERNFSMLKKGTKGRDALPSLINIVMELRKCCMHPYLLQGVEDIVVNEAEAHTTEEQFKCMVQSSGKLVLLDKFLPMLKADGHKVLIFSQMTRCLDILSDYLRGQNHSFERIDGNIRGPERQAAIDRFSAPNSDIFAFLLCTRAGGVGINLTAADTAIIFDSDWNPQNDLQAQARCHRIGQTKPVKVYRLITMNTYEQEMFDRAGLKLGLDKAVLQKMDANGSMGDDASLSSSENSNSASRLSKKEIEELLKKGAYGALLDESESKAFCEEDIEQILNKRTTVIKHDNANAVGSIFSKATFISSQASNELNVNDPLFWDKFAEKAHLQPLHPEKVEVQEDLEVPRQRRSQVRAYEQMRETYDDVEMDNPVEMALKWSPTEKLYFERRLMVFGLYNWEKLHEACPRRSILDLKVCARDLVRFLISKLNPVDDYQMAVDCESVVAEECDPYCNPFGDPLPYENANLRQVIEYKSFFLNAPKEYLETVERKAKFMLARIQLLKQVHDIVPADLKLAKQLYIPPITRPPAEWWGPEEDRDLMIGTLKHGYHLFRPMRTDTDLVFCKREYDPRTFQEHVTNGELPIYDNNEEVFMNGNDGLASNQNQTRSKRSESEDEEEELECEEEDIENTHLSNSTSMGEGSTKETILYAWPSKSELGSRLRRIVAAVLREKRKSAAAAAAAATVSAANANVNGGHRGASPSEKTDVNGNDTGKSQDINSTPNSKVAKWNKRERTDFFRTLCTYGVVVQPEPNQDKVDWSHLKELAGIPYKADTLLTEMYNHMVAMCKFLLEADIAKLTGATCMRPAEKFDGDEEYTLDKAKKLFKRIEFMEYLRNHVLTFQYLDTVLSQAKRTPGLPDWWQSGTHDRALLFGIAKHGYGRYESLVQDPEFNFYYMAESYRKEDVDMEGKIHILGLPWPKETIINKRIETLCLLAAPRHKWKQDPSQYTPPAYSPPQLIPVPTIVSSLHAQHELSTSAINIPKRLSPRANVTIEAWNHDGVQKKMTFTLPWGIHPSSSEEDESEACLSAVAQFLLDRIHSKRSERKPPTQEETPSKPTSPPQTLTTPSSGSLSATPALSNVSITSPPSASSTSTPGLPLKIRIRPFPSSNSISPSSESSPSSIFLHGKDSGEN